MMKKFVEELNLPKIPAEMCAEIIDHVKHAEPIWGTAHFISYECPEHISNWVRQSVFLGNPDWIIRIQVIRPGIAIHQDKRPEAINYLINKGEGRPVTSFWEDTEHGWQVLESFELNENQWYRLDVTVPHNVSNFFGDRVAISVEPSPKPFYGKKLNLPIHTKNEIIETFLKIKNTVNTLEEIEPHSIFWSLEPTGHHSFIDYGGLHTHKQFEKTNWSDLKKKIPELDTFLQKYHLYEFYTMIANHNFLPHKHYVNQNDTCGVWFIAYIENHVGELVFVEPNNYNDPYPDVGNAENMYYSELPSDVDYTIKEKILAEPGDLFILNTWQWHTYFTNNPNAKTLTMCIMPYNVLDYIYALENDLSKEEILKRCFRYD